MRARAPMLMIEGVEPRMNSSRAGCDATSTGTSGISASGRIPPAANAARMILSSRAGFPTHGMLGALRAAINSR